MQETLLLIQNHIRMVWVYRWVALVAATIVCLAGWTYVLLLPDRFEVTTQVYIDTDTMLTPLLRGLAIETRRGASARLISRTLLARPNLETVVRKTDMDLRAETPKQHEMLINRLEKEVRVSDTRRDNVFVISYQNADAKLAARVVDALLNILVERHLGESRRDASQSKQFIDEQIKALEAKLQKAELRLKDFKQRNLGVMPGSGGDYFARLETQAGQREQAELQLAEAVNRRDERRSQLSRVNQLLDELPEGASAIPHPLDGRIEKLEGQLDEMLMRYTENHPDVVSTRDLIGRLKAKREDELLQESTADDESGEGVSRRGVENPMYQQLKIATGAAEAEVAALQTRVEEFKRREEELKKLIDTSLSVETEFSRLNRDYAIDKRNYEELVKRREALKLAEEAGESTEAVQFNVIEPPRVPLLPTFPNRPLFNLAVLLIGWGSGAAVAWLFGMLSPTVFTREALEQLTELPVLGVVTRKWTQAQQLRRRMEVASFGVGCAFLVALCLGANTVDGVNVDRIPPGLKSMLSNIEDRFL